MAEDLHGAGGVAINVHPARQPHRPLLFYQDTGCIAEVAHLTKDSD